MQHHGTVILRTARLVLRPFTLSDAPIMYENWCNDPMVTRYLTWDVHPDVEETKRILNLWIPQYESTGYYHWCMTLSGEPIGAIMLFNCDQRHESTEIGFCIGQAWWGQGYTTEALTRVLQFLFDEIGLYRACARHKAENVGSGRVQVKAGMLYEGTLRGDYKDSDGAFHDMVICGITAPDWRKQHG